MKFKIVNLSDIGNYRKSNQDYLGYEKNKNGDLFAIVCDGMGGHAHGEIASKIAVMTFLAHFKGAKFSGLSNSEINHWLHDSIEKVVKVMKEYANQHPEALDMGTTLTAILITNHKAFVINIGDSRTYKYVDNKLFLVTKDQNLWNAASQEEQEKVRSSTIQGSRMNELTYWKVLTSALGPKKTLKIDTYLINDIKGTYLLTTDGIHDYIDEESIVEIMDSKAKLKNKGQEMIDYAKGNLSTDNLSILLLEVDE